jgi:hypothetical protein
MASYRSPLERSPLATIGGIIIGLVVLYVMFSIVGWIISLLYKFGVLILIASLIVDYKVALGFFRMLGRLFERNWVYGVVAGLATVAFYPFVSLYFLAMGLFKKKVKQAREEADVRQNGQWVDYEEVETEPSEMDITYEELPPPPEPETRRRDEPGYDKYFK